MSPLAVPTGEVWLPDIDPPGPWVDRAACTGHEPDWWFPDRGANVTQAVTICQACPVRAECLDYAVRWKIQFGIWGGLSPRRRRLLTRRNPRPRRPTPGHGTPGRYRYGCRCVECRDAHRVEAARYRDRSSEQAAETG